jgi:hypothetical protein
LSATEKETSRPRDDFKHKDKNENRTRKNNRGNIDDSFIYDG